MAHCLCKLLRPPNNYLTVSAKLMLRIKHQSHSIWKWIFPTSFFSFHNPPLTHQSWCLYKEQNRKVVWGPAWRHASVDRNVEVIRRADSLNGICSLPTGHAQELDFILFFSFKYYSFPFKLSQRPHGGLNPGQAWSVLIQPLLIYGLAKKCWRILS